MDYQLPFIMQHDSLINILRKRFATAVEKVAEGQLKDQSSLRDPTCLSRRSPQHCVPR